MAREKITITKRKAKGVLADMIADMDEASLAKTREKMERIAEDYVSYEIAKLLKEKGFDWPCHGSYHIEYPNNKIAWSPKPINDDGQIFMNAPTHQMAMKWLRAKDIDIVIMPLFKFKGDRIYCYEVQSETDDIRIVQFDTYEEAVEAALKNCLTNLI